MEVSASPDPSLSSPPHYRAVSLWAVLSVVCGAASATMFILRWLTAFFPLAAIYFGVKALAQIERVPEEYTGRRLAQAGIGLGAAFGILLGGWLIFVASEVPHGYQVLDWADLEPDPKNQHEIVPSSAFELNDKKVYVRGYILPGRQQLRLKEFSICRTSDQCRFATKTNRPIDLIHIELMGDRTIDFTTHQIGIGGIFHVDDKPLNGKFYGIKGDYP